MTSRFHAFQAARHLRQGGIITYPTEGVFGLGCDPMNPDAVDRLLALKGRPVAKGFILIAADFAQVEPYLAIPDVATRQRMLAAWPGPVTFVAPAAEGVPAWLRGQFPTLAVRVTNHPVAAALCQAFGGALVSTSANPSGKAPARTALTLRRYFPPGEVLNVAGALGGASGPTAIYDAVSGRRLR